MQNLLQARILKSAILLFNYRNFLEIQTLSSSPSKKLEIKKAALTSRRQALRSLLNQQSEEASDLLEFLIEEPELCLDAIRGYAAVENATGPTVLLERYSKFSQEQRRAVIETLASRQFYAEQLLIALKDNRIPRTDIPVHVARSLNKILGQSFIDYYGDVKPVTTDRIKTIAKYKRMVSGSALKNADASRGRMVYEKLALPAMFCTVPADKSDQT